MIKNQLLIFVKLYPELVERNSVKYPIEDALIAKLPELHGATQLKPKPAAKKVLLDGADFDRLLYIWEFCNNFSDLLETPAFTLEELQIALTHQVEPCTDIEGEENLPWAEQAQLKQLRERGFHLINAIHCALADCYLEELASSNDDSEHQDHVLISMHKIMKDDEFLWPEKIRLILKGRLGEHHNSAMDAFGQDQAVISSILSRLQTLHICDYSRTVPYEEKITLLECLIDGVHELQAFRDELAQRCEEKTQFNKEKMEVYQQIKGLEAEQAEVNKRHNTEEFQKLLTEDRDLLESLRIQLDSASRLETKSLKERFQSLKHKLAKVDQEKVEIEEAIRRKQA